VKEVAVQMNVGFIHRRPWAASGSPCGRFLLAYGVLMLVFSSGCKGKDRLDVSPVRGQVVYSGKGVPNATVIFHPVDPADERAAKMRPFAYADGEGRFEVKTYVTGDGAPPGKYRVSIIAPADGLPTRRKGQPTEASGSPVRIPPAIIQKYRNVDTAGIEVEIHEGENNLEPFELTM
jgi:hypothetical protein